MLGLECISSSQVVILAGIDNDTGGGVDSALLENSTLVHAEP
jgi:hypothetical protein